MRALVLSVLLTIPLLAQQDAVTMKVADPETTPPKLSSEILLQKAKTVAVLGKTGDIIADRGYLNPDGERGREKVIAVMKQWGKYAVVDDPDSADIVIEVLERQKNINLIRLANLIADIKVFKGRVPNPAAPLWEGSASESFRKLPATKVAEQFRDYVSKLKAVD